MAIPPLFSALLALLGLVNLTYALLNLKLLEGLRNLAKPRPKEKNQPSVTVLIAARNEESRIGKTLECLLAQNYPREKLQIVVVDDRSTDRTAAILREYAVSSPLRIDLVTIAETSPEFSPKKFALSQGLRLATGEIILTTDADCHMTKDWASSMVSEFGENTGLVLGMTTYNLESGGLAAGTAALEFFSYGVVASALVGLGFPVHGNANNIAYRRKVYDLSAGFAGHGRIVSGDDDFLLQSIHAMGKWEIRYSTLPGSQVQTEPPDSARHFWEQRKRWASKCSLYQPRQVAFLGAIFAYYCGILIMLAAGIFWRPLLWLGASSWAVKTGTDYLVMRKGARVFEKRNLMRWFLPTAAVHIPLIIAAVVSGSFGSFTWKGQTTGKVMK
jgi:cellulose synthase/poly-beta-1,6-N-acetylglucosamine synthase-like glycosyltransferase